MFAGSNKSRGGLYIAEAAEGCSRGKALPLHVAISIDPLGSALDLNPLYTWNYFRLWSAFGLSKIAIMFSKWSYSTKRNHISFNTRYPHKIKRKKMSEMNLISRTAASSRLGLTQTMKMYAANAATWIISIELHYSKTRGTYTLQLVRLCNRVLSKTSYTKSYNEIAQALYCTHHQRIDVLAIHVNIIEHMDENVHTNSISTGSDSQSTH